MANERKGLPAGVGYAVAAYTAWGLLPIYWKFLSSVDALQILSCRIIFSLLFVWALLALRRRADWPKILLDRKKRRAVALSATLISVNWGVYIWSVNAGHTVEAALGYYINPLVNVLLGLLFFKERLPRLQWAAFGIAAAGVGILTVLSGTVPWISLILAGTFGFYGMAKKKAGLDALDALGAETLILAAPAAALLVLRQGQGAGAFAAAVPMPVVVGLIGAGIVTALPLYWFARGAKVLPMSSLGFIQFISPTLQLLIGVLVFKEAFPARNLTAFLLVWTALGLYTYSAARLRVARIENNGI